MNLREVSDAEFKSIVGFSRSNAQAIMLNTRCPILPPRAMHPQAKMISGGGVPENPEYWLNLPKCSDIGTKSSHNEANWQVKGEINVVE